MTGAERSGIDSNRDEKPRTEKKSAERNGGELSGAEKSRNERKCEICGKEGTVENPLKKKFGFWAHLKCLRRARKGTKKFYSAGNIDPTMLKGVG